MYYKLTLENLSCQHCVARVSTALEQLDGVRSVHIHLEDQTVLVEADRHYDITEYKEALADTVYEVKEMQKTTSY